MLKLGIAIPCYNEQEVLEQSLDKLFEYLNDLKTREIVSQDSFICVVDDGSSDRTWEIIEQYKSKNTNLHGVKFSKNFVKDLPLSGLSEKPSTVRLFLRQSALTT